MEKLWSHDCIVEGLHMVGKGERCNWCGRNEKESIDDDHSGYIGRLRAFKAALAKAFGR